MMAESRLPPGYMEQKHRADARRYLARTANNLRALAEEMELVSTNLNRVGQPGRPTYSEVAGDALHAFASWHMNAHLEQITMAAADADIARAKGE